MRNYLLVLLRTLRRERLYAGINIAGLSLGVACCLILGLFLRSELTYDQYNVRHREIYRLVNEFHVGGKTDKFAVTSRSIAPMLAEENPDVIKSYVRFERNSGRQGGGGLGVRRGDKIYYWDDSFFVSPNVFDVFTHKILVGDPKTALLERGNVAISERMAKKYFGDENPIGQTLSNDTGTLMKVMLVFADQPANTHLKYDVLFSDNVPHLNEMDSAGQRSRYLFNVGNYTYLVMDPSFKPVDWSRINNQFWTKNMEERGKAEKMDWHSWVQPLRNVHLQSEVDYDLPNGNRVYLYGFSAVALTIFLIACINYMNLATARATRRVRSVGIRKILGASRLTLGLQFIGEAMLFAFLSLIFGIVIVEVILTLTPINELMGNQVRLDLLHHPAILGWLALLASVMGLLSGAYPAFYLSSWAPLTALTGKHSTSKGNLRLREVLVLLQFTISATAIACTLLMVVQMRYIANKPLGFEKENRLVITLRGGSTIEKIPAIRNELAKNSHVLGVAVASFTPGQNIDSNVPQVEQEDGTMAPMSLKNFPIGEGFEKVLGLQVDQGRDLSSRLLTDVGDIYLVNESMVRKMGWTSPLGKRIQFGEAGRVVGVVKDFNFKSLHTMIEPLIMYPLDPDISTASEVVRKVLKRSLVLNITGQDIGDTLAYIERVIAEADPTHPFEYTFLDASLNALYKSENHLTKLIAIFSAVSIFIACMGLFGLAAFTTEQRTREIGTRKVLGATTWQIITLLVKHTLLLALIASTFATVIAYFAMDEWLATFAYRASISPLAFMLTAVIASVIAFVTVALQSYKTASADPVKTLRHV